MGSAILRLKRRVGDEGIRVCGFDDFRCAFESAFGVAVFADFPLRRLLAQLVSFLRKGDAGKLRARAFVPFDF